MATPVAERLTGAPPFQVTERTNRLLQMSSGFAMQVDQGQQQQDENTPIRPRPLMTTTGVSSSFNTGMSNSSAIGPLSIPRQPTTPTKNIFDMSEHFTANNVSTGVMATAIKKNVGTPGSNALSRELLKRQDEVNMLRREAEPILTQMKRVAATGNAGPADHVRMLVGRTSSLMEQYDKVVARYERQLQKLISHMEHRRGEQDAARQEAERSLAHQLTLLQRELEEARERGVGAEGQARMLKREYEQVQRGLAARIAIEEGLQAENAEMRAELERLRAERQVQGSGHPDVGQERNPLGSSSSSELQQIQMLTAALEAAKQENVELRRQRELFSNNTSAGPKDTPTSKDDLRHRLEDTLKAKHTQEAYFESLIATIKQDHTRANESLQSALEAVRTDSEALRSQLAEQQSRAQRYSQAIDQTADRCYAENRQLADRLAETQKELQEREEKMGQLVGVAEELRAQRTEKETQISRLEQRLNQLSSRPQSESSSELSEARKQIAHLEQAILDLSDRKHSGKDGEELGTLKRQLAQVEFEKTHIESTLRREREKASRPTATLSYTSGQRLPERIIQAQAELAALKPALPRLLDRLASALSLRSNPTIMESPRPLALDAIDRVYTDVKASFDGLEAARLKALQCADKLGGAPVASGPIGPPIGDRTPTMNRQFSSGIPQVLAYVAAPVYLISFIATQALLG